MVPAPLVLIGDLVLVHVYAMHDAEWFGVYGESAVQIPVRHEASGTTGAYSPLLVVEGDGPVAAGRKIYGQPKKAGRITLEAHGDLLVGTVTRNDITIITATMPYKQLAGTPEDLEKHASFRTNILGDPQRRRIRLVSEERRQGPRVTSWLARSGEATGPRAAPERPVPVHLLPVRRSSRPLLARPPTTPAWSRPRAAPPRTGSPATRSQHRQCLSHASGH
jgi:hypothetical protein